LKSELLRGAGGEEMIKVGDMVRIKTRGSTWEGKIGKVVEMKKIGGGKFRFQIQIDTWPPLFFSEHEVEKISGERRKEI